MQYKVAIPYNNPFRSHQELTEAYQVVFSGDKGQMVLEHLALMVCGLGSTMAAPSDELLHQRAGRQKVGEDLLSILNFEQSKGVKK